MGHKPKVSTTTDPQVAQKIEVKGSIKKQNTKNILSKKASVSSSIGDSDVQSWRQPLEEELFLQDNQEVGSWEHITEDPMNDTHDGKFVH